MMIKIFPRKTGVFFAMLCCIFTSAQISMAATGSYQQNFNGLISTGTGVWTDNATVGNWYAQRTGSGNTLSADAGTSSGGNLYSYGSVASADRALGSLGSGNAAAGNFAFGTLLKNNSSVTITDIKVSYTGEQWRNSGAGAQTIAFLYRIASSPISALQASVTTGWTAVPALDFISPITGGGGNSLNGNLAANQAVKNNISLPGLSIPAGSYILLKWDDPDHMGSDHGLSIDDVTISWTVSDMVKPEPTNFPTNFMCGATTTSSIPLSWTDAAGSTVPDGYLIQWSPTSYGAITAPSDGTPVPDGASAKNVGQGTQSFNATGLSANSTYFFKIWSYTNSGSNINYKLIGEPQTSCTTQAVVCNFLEDFSSIPASSSTYQDRTWEGTGGTWSATDARTDQTLTGRAITIQDGVITSPSFSNGISTLSFKAKFPFKETSGDLLIKVNGTTVGTLLYSEMNGLTPITKTMANINIPGNIVITLASSGARYAIDDVQWTCYNGVAEPNINIQGNGVTILNGDSTPSTTDGTDFGGAIFVGTDVEKTFTMQNLGSANLNLTNVAVILSDSTNGFSVSAQPTINPLPPSSNQTFKIKFNNSVPGTYTNTVSIGSNDPDTPNYTFQIKATVTQPVLTTDKNSLSGFTYALSQGPSATQDFVVNGSSLGGDITASASPDWEISTNLTYDGANVPPWSTIVLPRSGAGAVTNKTIHVRLKDGLPVGTYAGSVVLTSPNAVSQSVSLSGQVTAGIRDIKVTGNGTSVNNGSTTPYALNNTLFATQNIGNSQTKSFEIINLGAAALTIGAITLSGLDATSFSILNGPAAGTILNQNQTAGFQIKFAPTTVGTKNATLIIANNDPDDSPFTFAIRGGAVYCSSAGEIVIARQDFEVSPEVPVLSYTLNTFGSIAPGSSTGFSSGSSGGNASPKSNNLYSAGARGYRIQGGDPIGEVTSGIRFTFAGVDTSAYTNISLSFKIAGFSLGSTSNGMDDLDAANVHTTIHADKLDYVLVEISPDGGTTWYQQAKIVSGKDNLAWGFASNSTGPGSRNYAANNNLTYFSSTDALRYSTISIDNLPAVPALKVRISAQDNALNESWILDEVKITSSGLLPKIWNGISWSPSLPISSDRAIIRGDYDTAVQGGFQVCQCEIEAGHTLRIAANTEVKVADFLINEGKLSVGAGGNFMQVNENDTNSGSGTFTAEQKINLSAARNQYNYLISPAEGFNMTNLYKNSVDANNVPVSVPYVLYHNEATNTFLSSSGAYIKGRGLAVKEAGSTYIPTTITGVFEGKPANGFFSYPLVNSNPANEKRGYNLIGNPYPSRLDLIKFYQDNSGSGNLSPTFYFWDHTSNTRTTQEGDGYKGQAYAQFNAATPVGVGTATNAPGEPGSPGLKIPTRYVSVGQGFMAKVENASTQNVVFSNSDRASAASQGFFGKGEPQKAEATVDRYWLMLINPQNIASNIAVVYFKEGNDAYTKDDSPSLGGSDALYSVVEGKKISINGKSNFVPTDVVALGTAHFVAGNYTIALDRAEGLFAGVQNIYLKDFETGIITNLREGSYTFAAAAGESTGRFEIIYEAETILATDGAGKDELLVYRNGGDFVVKAASKLLTGVEMYDAMGRLMYQSKPNSRTVIIKAENLPGGVYIVRTDQHGHIRSKKIMK